MRLKWIPALLLALCATAQAAAQDYLLRPGDRVDINVLEDPGLNREALVRPDGKISLPLAGAVDAAGLTPEQLAAQIRLRLRNDFVTPPTVTVALVQIGDAAAREEDEGTIRIYMLGEVAAPGVYDLDATTTILQALAISGGPGVFAARDRMQIRRGDEVLLFDYELIEAGATPANAIGLRDGDVVVVPERGLFD